MKAFAANMPSLWPKIATEVKSSTETSDYGWIGEVPHLREWVGPKIVNRLKAHSYSLTNVPYEVTVGVHKHK